MGNTRTSKHRHRRRTPRRPSTRTGFEPPQHTMWTVEGQIEGLARFAEAVNRSGGWRRRLGKTMLLLPLLAGVLVGIASTVIWLLD
jgi:hypothetical protein